MADIQLRDVPEQVVLTEQRTIGTAELQDFLRDAMDRQYASARSLGGPAGAIFVIYHGQFTDDTPEVPVEVCLPIPPTATTDLPTSREPAHREAYLRLTKAQFADPADIGAAFGTVAQWLAEQGHTIADAPREIYFTDFSAAAADDEVCDIAFPIA